MKTRLIALLLALLMFAIPAAADVSPTVSAGHTLLVDMNAGPCKTLTGNVQVIVLIVSTGDEPWTEEEIAAIRQEAQAAGRMLRIEAASYGASLNISLKFHTAAASSAPARSDSGPWVSDLLAGIPGLRGYSHGSAWDNTPLLIFCSTQGRAFARCQYSDRFAEYAVFYRGDDSGVIRHEMLHLFGAEDYYVEDTIAEAAGRIFPNSVMLNSDYQGTVDELTAYAIGWTDFPGENALQLLSETASVTSESLAQSREADQVTGLGVSSGSESTYNGMMVDGVWQGWGHLAWRNGDSYLGFFEQGTRDGQGMYFWADGSVYSGDFVQGARTGQGVTTWPDGTSYSGGFRNGQRHGKGVYTWPDGSVYSGDFVDGARTGQGTYISANGSVYTGGFLNGEFDGQGTLIFADGSCYTGGFRGGLLHGTGTYHWASGSSFTGSFVDGKRHGKGVYRGESGSILEGEWVDDKYVP